MRDISTKLLLLLIGGLLIAPASGVAQNVTQEIRESQERLQQVRQERERLQNEMTQLQSQVRSASLELENLQQQVEASRQVLEEIDFQSLALASNAAEIGRELRDARSRLRDRTEVLRERLRAVYKSGPLHSVRVLLSARSFGDLLNRYKYLHLITLYDRMLVEEVQELESTLQTREADLRQNLRELEELRDEKSEETARLERLQSQAATAVRGFRARADEAESRLAQLERDESRLSGALADMEERRLAEERRRVIAGNPSTDRATLDTEDLGTLNWPVDGQVLYQFGPERRPNGVTLRWNGIGIQADAGTPVQAVEGGTVQLAGPFEGYGPSVFVSHGNGYWTVYLYLRSITVREGQQLSAGDVIGTVGGERTPEGPHIEFQVRVGQGGVPTAVDPLPWLRDRSR